MTAIKQLLAPSEAEFQASIVELAHLHHWHVAHFRSSPRPGGGHGTAVAYDGAGFPDLVLTRDRIIFAEVKTEKGRLSPAQEEWAGWLQMADASYFVWRPSDWDAIKAELRPITPGVKPSCWLCGRTVPDLDRHRALCGNGPWKKCQWCGGAGPEEAHGWHEAGCRKRPS